MIDWHTFLFYLFALLACGFAIAVAVSRHIVHMAFYLIVSLGAVAGLFFLAGAELVGAMQLMIYVGGTLVLLVFGVMLTGQSRFVQLTAPGSEYVFSGAAGFVLLAMLLFAALSNQAWTTPPDAAATKEAPGPGAVGLALAGVRGDQPPATDDNEASEDEESVHPLSAYLLPFEIVSVHLLVVLIGAAYLARARRSEEIRAAEEAIDAPTE